MIQNTFCHSPLLTKDIERLPKRGISQSRLTREILAAALSARAGSSLILGVRSLGIRWIG